VTASATHGGWSGVAEAYAAHFAPLCAGTQSAVLLAAGLRPGVEPGLRVLDVGAGPGGLTVAALECGAVVTAVDPDVAMVDIASKAAPLATVQQAGLPELPFPDGSFDVVIANFVVNQLTDPLAGVTELARVAAPGGRVVVTIWPSGTSAQGQLWADVLAAAEARPVPGVRLPADKDFPRTTDGLDGLLTSAGLIVIEAHLISWEHRAEPDALWLGAAAGIGGIGETMAAQTPEVRVRLREAYETLVTRHVRDDVLTFEATAVVAVGVA
jgi:SAM-dependent methyltransferase